MAWDFQKPKIGPLYPPMDTIWAHFVGILGQFRVKNAFFSKKIFLQIASQMVWDPQKPKIGPLCPPEDPILAHFLGSLGQFGGQKCVFLKKKFC